MPDASLSAALKFTCNVMSGRDCRLFFRRSTICGAVPYNLRHHRFKLQRISICIEHHNERMAADRRPKRRMVDSPSDFVQVDDVVRVHVCLLENGISLCNLFTRERTVAISVEIRLQWRHLGPLP